MAELIISIVNFTLSLILVVLAFIVWRRERQRGKWGQVLVLNGVPVDGVWRCTVCKSVQKERTRFCGSCGVRMEE